MSIISQEIWNNLPEDFKQSIITEYNERLFNYAKYQTEEDKVLIDHYEYMYDKENLQPKPKIKTWRDVVINSHNIYDKELNPYCGNPLICCITNEELREKINLKIQATIKIAKLIELSYGGKVRDEEWNNDTIKHCAVRHESEIVHACAVNDYEFIAFHTIDQYDEFMSYPENVELIKQYYII